MGVLAVLNKDAGYFELTSIITIFQQKRIIKHGSHQIVVD